MKKTRVILAVLVTTSLVAIPVLFKLARTGASSSTDTLLAYLKFDETSAGSTAIDSSGDGNDGTPGGDASTDPTPDVDVPTTDFANGRSLSFDPLNNQHVDIAADASINSLSSVTVSAWVKINDTGDAIIAQKYDYGNSFGFSLEIFGGNIMCIAGSAPAAATYAASNIDDSGWHHLACTVDNSNQILYVDGVAEDTEASTGYDLTSTDVLRIGGRGNGDPSSPMDGKIDDLRIYGRAIGVSEVLSLAGGEHTSATWTGAVSSNYETAGNWDIGAVPDNYSLITIADTANKTDATANIGLAGLTINSGGRLNMAGFDLTMNDGGTFASNGTLQLKNTESLSGVSMDTDSGTVLLTTDSDTFGLVSGSSYNNLILNDSTFAHWPLDEDSGSVAVDVSGYGRDADYQGAPTQSTTVADLNYANGGSLSFNGSTDYAEFGTTSLPGNATYCAWVNMDAGSGVVLGSTTSEHYALAINSGNSVAVRNESDDETVSWGISSVYGGWHHICLTQTTTITSTLSLYVDGAAVGGSEVLTSGVAEINTIGRGGTGYFDGLIDDVRVYSRTLTPTEIDDLFDGEQPATYVSTLELGGNLDVNGDLVINSGRFDASASNYSINLAGDFLGNGGVFNPRSGTVVLDGADQAINSSNSFYNLTKQVSAAATLTFGKSSTTTMANELTLNGASSNLLSLRSSTPGVQWNLDAAGDEIISYLDVQDSNNIDAEPVDITGANITDSGNNTNWTVNVAPDDPTSLGPSQFVDGSWTTNNQPTLSFTLADDNPLDELRFRMIIDNNNDFSSPELDYVSDLGAQGARNYTVGQNGSDDTYNVGSDSMFLTSGDYYWQVKAIDDYDTPNESSYTVANGGSLAFRLDVTGPTDPGVPTTASSQTNKRPVWNWAASTDAGIGLDDPTYNVQWSTASDFSSVAGAAFTNNITYTHGSDLADGNWYFRVRAADDLSNNSNWSTSAVHIIDTTGPTTPVAPFTGTPTFDNTPTWSWAAASDAGVGLHSTTPYQVRWSTTSNFSGTVYNDNSSSNIFTHATSLADNTWYMQVRAVDALNNVSAWSSNGTVLIDGTAPSNPGQPSTADNPTNDNTPEWTWAASIDIGSGLAASPYTVQWSSESDFMPLGGSTTSTTNSYTHGTPLGDGTWYMRVNARDNLNNTSGYSVTGQTTIDTVAPDQPDAPTTTTPTNDDTPTWAWPVPDDTGVGLAATPYTVEWSQDSGFGSGVGSDTVDTNEFTHDTPLGEGDWYFRVYATDSADNTSVASNNGTAYIDLTPPTVPGDPSTADPVSEDTPTWTWTASSDSGIGLDATPYELQWSLDSGFGSGVFSDTSATNSFTHTDTLSDGEWYFRVRAVDGVGNQSAYTNAGSKVIDVSPPTVPGDPSTTSPTNDSTPEWTWAVSTDAGVGLHATPYMIEWSQDNTFLSGVESDTITPNSFTHPDPLADGTWYFRVRAQDSVGNVSAYSNIGVVFVDVTEPTTPGNPSTTTPTNDDTPTWTWAASSDGSGSGLDNPAYTVEWSEASDFGSGVSSSTSNTASYTHVVSLDDGTWYFRVRATDVVNNVSSDSANGMVVIDDTAPSVPGTPSTATPTNDDTPTWTWAASTDGGVGLADPEYELRWSQTSDFSAGVFTDTSTTNGYTHSVSLADGTWYFEVRAKDNLDNTSAYSSSGTVLVSTAGPTTPGTPSTTDPTTDTTPTWTWAASTSLAGLANPAYTVEWSQDSGFGSGVSTDTTNIESFTHSTTLADGTWYFRVIAEDNTNLFSSYSANGSVLVDTTAPSTPPAATTDNPNADDTPTWTWAASTDDGVGLDDPAYIVEWSEDNGFGSGVESSTSSSNSFTHSDPLSDGTWYFRIKSVDALGNESAFGSNSSTEIDASAPSTPGTPSTTNPTNDQTPTWTWAASTDGGVGLDDPAYTVEWSQASDFSSGVSSDTTNSDDFTHPGNLADGTWYFRVRATDQLGNNSAYSGNGEVEIDSSIPSVPGTPTAGAAATNDQTPTWTWSGSSDVGVGLDTPAYQVQWSQDEDFIVGINSDTAAAATFTHSGDLAAGTWYFRVRAVDGVNNLSGYSGNGEVYVDIDVPDAPGTPTTDESPTNDPTPTWTWAASSDTGYGFGAAPYEVEWSQTSDFSSGVLSTTSTSEEFTHIDSLADGDWYVRVRAVDDAGNQSPYSGNASITIDATGPTLPADVETDTPTKNPTPTWTWAASIDAGEGLGDPAYELQWSQDENFVTGVFDDTTNDTTYTHGTGLANDVWYFRVRAVDSLFNTSDWVVSEVYLDHTPPQFSQVNASPGSTSVVLSWTTDEVSSTQVEYGIGGQFTESTTEVDVATKVTNHGAVISGLKSCATYSYRVVGTDELDNAGTGSAKKFTTTSCSGNAAVMEQTNKFITTSSGGNLTLASGTANARLSVPSGFAGSDSDFQIKQISPAAALTPTGLPENRFLIGEHVYDIKAMSGVNTSISNFSAAIGVSMTYSADDVTGFNAGTLAIYRNDGNGWQQLDNCSTNLSTRVASCQTQGFSVFGLFGTKYTPAPDPVIPEGDGEVDPEPDDTIIKTIKDEYEEKIAETAAQEDSRGIGTAISKVVSTVTKRPSIAIGVLLLLGTACGLYLTYRRKKIKKLPFGIHKDE